MSGTSANTVLVLHTLYSISLAKMQVTHKRNIKIYVYLPIFQLLHKYLLPCLTQSCIIPSKKIRSFDGRWWSSGSTVLLIFHVSIEITAAYKAVPRFCRSGSVCLEHWKTDRGCSALRSRRYHESHEH